MGAQMWTVVVVDDEKNFCTLLSEYIHTLAPRFQVAACFQDGRAAWNFLRNHNVDLVISDVRMPHMSGLDLAQRLFADDRSIPVVLISGYSEFEYAKQAIQYGVVNYLLKPVDFEELRETLARLDKQLLSRHKSENAEGQAALFLFYAISGLFESREILLRAAALAGAPFQPETDGFALLEVRVNASAQNVERENMGLILETLLRGPFAGNHIYRVYEAADAFYFVAVGPHAPDAETQAGAWRAALEEVADFSVSLVILAQAAGLFAFCQQIAQCGLRERFSSSISREEVADSSLSGEVADDQRAQRKRQIYRRALAYMRDHVHQDLSREDVAGAVYVSQGYLSHLFSEMAGMSFVECLTQIRMERAVALLATNMRINDIAERVGYRNRKSFLVNFRSYTGLTPSEYRQKYCMGGES